MKNWLQNGQFNWPILEQQDWIAEMAACMQDPVWHAEGDVLTHTRMVLDALMQLPEYQELNPEAQLILRWSALMHDVGKPATTRTEDGRIISPKHALVGEKITRDLLWNMDFTTREHICALVRLHGLPLWALDKNNPNRSVISSSLRVSNRLIYLIAKADVYGRIGPNEQEYLDRCDYFKELCLENECFDQPKAFHNAHSRFRFFQTDAPYPAELFDDTAFEVIMMSGLPGSGKDTVAGKFDLPMVSLDALRRELRVSHDDKDGQGRVAQEAYKRAKTYCAQKQSFIWNSTNLTHEMRSRLVNTLSVYNPKFRIVYVETTVENILARRAGTIPKNRLSDMFRKLDMPLVEEVHEVEYRRH